MKKLPVLNEPPPPRLSSQDGKWPDSVTLIPLQAGRALVWDVTVVALLADF